MLDTRDYALVLANALKKNESIVFACHCSIRYSGRAESFLSLGDRIILIKSDNTLVVHQPMGNNPVNYMKPGTSHSLVLEHGKTILKSRNLALKEYLDIEISKIYFYNAHKLEDGQSIQIAGTEKDMAMMIFEQPHLIEEGFKPLKMEEHTKYGFIDVFGYDKDNILTVIECKRYAGDPKAVDQLRRYVEKIKSSKGLSFVRGILACPHITPRAEQMLQEFGYQFAQVNPPKYLERFDPGGAAGGARGSRCGRPASVEPVAETARTTFKKSVALRSFRERWTSRTSTRRADSANADPFLTLTAPAAGTAA